MNEDWRDPNVLGGLILALTAVGATITIIVIERF